MQVRKVTCTSSLGFPVAVSVEGSVVMCFLDTVEPSSGSKTVWTSSHAVEQVLLFSLPSETVCSSKHRTRRSAPFSQLFITHQHFGCRLPPKHSHEHVGGDHSGVDLEHSCFFHHITVINKRAVVVIVAVCHCHPS